MKSQAGSWVSRIALVGWFLVFSVPVQGQPPERINYQGRLVDGDTLVNGPVALVIGLYTNPAPAVGETVLCVDSSTVTVVDGLFSTVIGDELVPPGSLPQALEHEAVYLQITADGTPLLPRERLSSVAYALNVSVADGSVTSQKVAWVTMPIGLQDGDDVGLTVEGDPVYSAAPASSLTDAGSGAVITGAERAKLTGIETGADVTDAANVAAAGALMSGAAASGDLTGTYPSPQISSGSIVNADVSPTAAIAASKIADGADSGLDADLLDGTHGTSYLRSDASDTFTSGTLDVGAVATLDVNGTLRMDGTVVKTGTAVVNNFNADLLDGVQGDSYLRSDANDTYSGTTLTLSSSSTLNVDGRVYAEELRVGQDATDDDDYIYFDGAGEYLRWLDSSSHFEFSDEVQVQADLLVGENVRVGNLYSTDDDYVYFDASAEYLMWDESASEFVFSDDARVMLGLSVGGDLDISGTSGTDDDTLYFDSTSEYLRWVESYSAFVFSADAYVPNFTVSGTLNVGAVPGGGVAAYNNMSIGRVPASGEMGSKEDLFIGFDLEVGDDLLLSRKLYMEGDTGGTSDGDQNIYFYEDGSRTSEYLRWDDSLDRFQISDDLYVAGTLSKSAGSFMIDHPLDPANKYLSHSFVESPDMKNVYDGVVTLDTAGEATVEMPEWFGALNRDFRYQLTCIGGFAPVYIAEEIADNRFRIAGGTPEMKVSWQVTGIRQDAYANAHRIPVEEDKPEDERGKYAFPALFGQPETMAIGSVDPKDMPVAQPKGGVE